MQKDEKNTINAIENQIKKLRKDLNFLKNMPIKSGEKTRKVCLRNLEVQLIKAEYQVFLLKSPAAV